MHIYIYIYIYMYIYRHIFASFSRSLSRLFPLSLCGKRDPDHTQKRPISYAKEPYITYK